METLALARAYADKIKQQVGAGFTPQIVESLPTVGDATILYLVLKEGTAPQGNIYDEYLWINGAYEHIGDTATLMTVDNTLSATSENPVQNKVIKAALDKKQDIIQYSVMPEASADLANKIIQYVGNTTTIYTQGLFYKCVNALTKYQWQKISVSSDNSKLDKPDITSVSAKLVTYSLATGTGIKNIDNSISSSSTDNDVPTAKAVYDYINSLDASEVSY